MRTSRDLSPPAAGCTGLLGTSSVRLRGRRGQAEDSARRALGMAPIRLTDEGIERIEALAGGVALEVLEDLPADQREAVRARVVDERPYEEIAAELHCSPSVVRKRVSRGVQAIRSEMEVPDEH